MRLIFDFRTIILIYQLALYACSASRSEIKPVTEDPNGAIFHPVYTTFLENAGHYLRVDTLVTESTKSFSEAILKTLNGQYSDAIPLLSVYEKEADTSLVESARDTRNALNLLLSRWSELEVSGDSIIGQSFASQAKETYEFKTTVFEFPITLSSSRCPIVEVTINGVKKRFWLDTGAGMTVLSSETATQCAVGGLTKGSGVAGTATNIKVGYTPGVVKELKLGDLTIQNHPVIIIDKKDLEFKLFGIFSLLKIEGIIGWNAIQNLDLTIDYKRKQVRIAQPEKRETTRRNLFWFNYPIVAMKSPEGVKLLFGLDTGARKTSITTHILQKLPQTSYTEKTKYIGSAGGIDKIKSITLPDLTITGFGYSFHFDKISSLPKKGTLFVKTDGVLGSDIFQGGKIRIDFRNGLFVFEEYDK